MQNYMTVHILSTVDCGQWQLALLVAEPVPANSTADTDTYPLIMFNLLWIG